MNSVQRGLAIAAGLTAAAIWGGMYVVSKVVLDVIPPFTLLSLRLILGSLTLVIFVLMTTGFQSEHQSYWRVFLIGLVGYGISLGLQFTGTKLSSAANAAMVTSASPVFIFLFGVWLLRERVTVARVMALILATVGVIVIIDPRAILHGDISALGNLLLVGAAVTWGLYSVMVKQVSLLVSTLEVSAIAFLGGLPISIPISVIEVIQIGIGPITPMIVLGIIYLGLISTALAMYLWNKSLAMLEAGLVALLFFAQPLVGVALGNILLNEQLSPSFWLGSFFIIFGLILAALPTNNANAQVGSH